MYLLSVTKVALGKSLEVAALLMRSPAQADFSGAQWAGQLAEISVRHCAKCQVLQLRSLVVIAIDRAS